MAFCNETGLFKAQVRLGMQKSYLLFCMGVKTWYLNIKW
jgi:hypothetical protein